MLRLTLLHELQRGPATSVTELASRVRKLRPSVSRSLHALQAEGLVTLEAGEWQVSSSGREEVHRATEQLRESGARVQRSLATLATRLATPVVPAETLRAFEATRSELDASLRVINAHWASLSDRQEDLLRQFRESFAFKVPRFDIPRLQDIMRRWIPDNLQEVPDLDAVATVALDEGVPLCWIPRREIVFALIGADGPRARLDVLTARRDDVLDDCDVALASIPHEWSAQCRSAIEVLRLGHDGPAQSHAANIVDSIVLARFGDGGRNETRARASEDLGEQPIQRAAEYLTMLPLFRAFTPWRPRSGAPPPDYFARHPTAHAVGTAGVFAPLSALIAVMLATSLTVQFASSATTGTVLDPHAADPARVRAVSRGRQLVRAVATAT